MITQEKLEELVNALSKEIREWELKVVTEKSFSSSTSVASLSDLISFMVIRPMTRSRPSFNISVSTEPPLDKGRKYLQEISTVVISWYLPIALITATIIAVSAALTMA